MLLTGILVVFSVIVFILWRRSDENKPVSDIEIPEKWRTILDQKVLFYRNLDEAGKRRFETDIYRFLGDVIISGVQTEVTIEDRMLVASSAVIPLFGFPAWNYRHLDEVILYPSSFDRNFNIGSTDEVITGMVGNGPMEGKMILSKPSLHTGFEIANDKRNVGIHEFVHLFDKESGAIDGIPPGFDHEGYTLPWLDFISHKTNQIVANRSDIDGYATTNRQEFFAVASEYFFERPHLLKKKHPRLYSQLVEVFNQEMTERLDPAQGISKKTIGRNEPCPCGSGNKYKRCCLD